MKKTPTHISLLSKYPAIRIASRFVFSHMLSALFIFVAATAAFMLGPSVASAEVAGASFTFFRVPEICNTRECGWLDFVALGNEVLRFAVYMSIFGATIAFTFAGFKMLTNADSSGEIEKAKKIIWTAAIGIVVTLSAWLIVKFILDNFGVGAEFRKLVQ